MNDKKITFIRGLYISYDDSPIITLPHHVVGETIVNMIRTVYRKFKFLFFSLGVTLGFLFFVKSSKYDLLQKLHYADLIDAMKKED